MAVPRTDHYATGAVRTPAADILAILARGAEMVANAAAAVDMPEPVSVGLGIELHQVMFQLGDAAAVMRWAEWLRVGPPRERDTRAGIVHFTEFDAEMFDMPFKVYAHRIKTAGGMEVQP